MDWPKWHRIESSSSVLIPVDICRWIRLICFDNSLFIDDSKKCRAFHGACFPRNLGWISKRESSLLTKSVRNWEQQNPVWRLLIAEFHPPPNASEVIQVPEKKQNGYQLNNSWKIKHLINSQTFIPHKPISNLWHAWCRVPY